MIKYLSIFILVFTLAFVGFQNDIMASRRDNHRSYHNYHHTDWDDYDYEDDDDEDEDNDDYCEEGEDNDDPATPTPTPTPIASASPIASATPTSSPIVTPTPVITATATASPAPTQNPDVCPNIDGVQLNLPDEYHHDNAGINCLKFELGGPNPSNAIGGANVTSVAKSGQVLGASTMASTGATEDAIFNTIFTFGSLLTSFGIMKNGKKAVKS